MSTNNVINYGTINGTIIQDNNGVESKTNNPEKKPANQEERDEKQSFEYDIAVSYSSTDERYVSRVVNILEQEGLKVFFAPNCEEEFMAQDMIVKFYKIYRYQSEFVVAFVSSAYVAGDVTMQEANSALLRTRDEQRNCLIPVYLDGTKLPQLNPDINYISVNRNGYTLREVEVADKILRIVKKYSGKQK